MNKNFFGSSSISKTEMQTCCKRCKNFFISWPILLFLDQLLLLTNGLIKIHNFLSCLYLPGHKQTYSCCNQPCNSPPLVILPLWRASPGKTPTNKSNSFHPPKTNKKDYQLRARELRKRENVALYFTHTHREMLTTPLQRILQLWKMHTHAHWRFGSLRDATQCKNKHHPRANTR